MSSNEKILSEEDHVIFWHFLSGTRGCDSLAKRVEVEKITRVFMTLDMFPSHSEMTSFMKAWNCQLSNTVTFQELRDGMGLLTSPQLDKFDRFMKALRQKSQADKEKQRQRQLEIEKQLKKEEQKEKALAARSTIPSSGKTALIHRTSDGIRDGIHSFSKNQVQCNSPKNGSSNAQGRKGFFERIAGFMRKLSSTSSSGSAKIADVAFSSPAGSPASLRGKEPTYLIKQESNDSEEGFTFRLSKANLAALEEEDGAPRLRSSSSSSRMLRREFSAIAESLASFDDLD